MDKSDSEIGVIWGEAHSRPIEVCPHQSAPVSSLLNHFSTAYRQRQLEWEKEKQDRLPFSIWQP